MKIVWCILLSQVKKILSATIIYFKVGSGNFLNKDWFKDFKMKVSLFQPFCFYFILFLYFGLEVQLYGLVMESHKI